MPIVRCEPGTFDQTIIDTSSSPLIRTRYYLSITKVSGLETSIDEFGAAFPVGGNGSEGLTTIRRSRTPDAGDELVPVRFRSITEATTGTPITARDLEGSIGRGAGSDRQGTIYFAAKESDALRGDYDLFSGHHGAGRITDVERIPISSVVPWDAQPALAPDGRTLYFASDRNGGFGGVDIYASRLGADGAWSEPENLGAGVNTSCDEISPWLSGDGQWIYFASNGHQTVGGYDLFRAPVSRGQIGGAQNLGKPINTPRDEIFPSAPANADPDTLLYYSSDQNGSKLFDVYVLYKRKRAVTGKVVDALPPRKVTLIGKVEDSKGRPVDSAKVSLEERDPPGRKDSTITDLQGGYQFEIEEGKRYGITAGSDTTLYGHEEIFVPPTGDSVVVRRDIVIPDTITFRVNFPFNNATDPYEFTLDDRGLPSSDRWLDIIDRMAEFLRRRSATSSAIEVVGHTDPVGSDPFNLDLGRRRAEFVRRELIKRGVPAGSLVVRSEGEGQPLPPRPAEPEDLYHARLRRVELVRQ